MDVYDIGRNEELMVPHIYLGFSAKFTQGGSRAEQTKKRQRGTRSPKDFFLRLEGYGNKPNT